MIRVLHAAETTQGGVQTILSQHLQAQTEAFGQDNVTAFIPEQDRKSLSNVINDGQLSTFERSGRNIISMWRFFYLFTSCVLRFRPTIVHLHSSFAGILGRLSLFMLKPFLRPQVIYCPHGFSFIMTNRRRKTKWLYTILERVFAYMTDAIICVSEYEKRIAEEKGLRKEVLTVIPNGIDIAEARRAFGELGAAEISERSARADDPIELLFVGRFDAAKGVEVLIQAFSKLPKDKYALTVIGSSVLSDSSGWTDETSVRVIGWQPKHVLYQHYARADVLIVPSRWEAFGLVVVEAATQACPALASNVGGLAELIDDGTTGRLFEADSPTDLLRVLTTVSRKDWRTMGLHAQSLLPTRFSSERMTGETINLYVQITT